MNTIASIRAQLVIQADGCHVWPGKRNYGYGYVMFDRRSYRVHRLIYEHCVGPIPEGLVIDHLCGNRACANPEHLEAVTQKVNFNRGKGSGEREKTHCPAGHPYAGENLVIKPDGKRRCRTCHAGHAKRRAHLKAEREGRVMRISTRDRTYCPAGHPYSPENTVIRPKTGWRQCRQCRRDRALQAYYQKKQAARDASSASDP